jgi:hypothetical protein
MDVHKTLAWLKTQIGAMPLGMRYRVQREYNNRPLHTVGGPTIKTFDAEVHWHVALVHTYKLRAVVLEREYLRLAQIITDQTYIAQRCEKRSDSAQTKHYFLAGDPWCCCGEAVRSTDIRRARFNR